MSLAGSLLLGWAALRVRRLVRVSALGRRSDNVTLLKPLYGAEPNLAANLATFLDQDHDGAVQMLCGVQGIDDPAIPVVSSLKAARPGQIDLIVDSHQYGSNAKVSNLINLSAHIRHDVVILSDSDIAVGWDYLPAILNALAQPRVGGVTCLYRGRGDRGVWSRIAAMGIDLHFLPSVLIGLATGLAKPCMGSTIALRRETLDRIGGFAPFSNILADDYALGAAIRAQGLQVAVPDFLVIHACKEESLADLARQELRWNATVAGIDPWGYLGSVVLHPLPLALLAAILGGFTSLAWSAIALALIARALVAIGLGHSSPATFLLVPARDILSFLFLVPGFFVRSVDWRGTRLVRTGNGRVIAETEISE